MSSGLLRKQIRDFVVTSFLLGDESFPLRDEDSFLESNVIDSTGVLELVTFVEETFEVQVEDTELIPENFDSIHNLATYLQGKGVDAG